MPPDLIISRNKILVNKFAGQVNIRYKLYIDLLYENIDQIL